MISLIVSFVALFAGDRGYGRLVEKVFSPDQRATPAVAIHDGVDCVPMKPWKVFLVLLLVGTVFVTSPAALLARLTPE